METLRLLLSIENQTGRFKYTLNEKGYARVTARATGYRQWYLHRAIVDALSKQWSFYGPGIPKGWLVHHMDFDKLNNKPHNLLMVPPELAPDVGEHWYVNTKEIPF